MEEKFDFYCHLRRLAPLLFSPSRKKIHNKLRSGAWLEIFDLARRLHCTESLDWKDLRIEINRLRDEFKVCVLFSLHFSLFLIYAFIYFR